MYELSAVVLIIYKVKFKIGYIFRLTVNRHLFYGLQFKRKYCRTKIALRFLGNFYLGL